MVMCYIISVVSHLHGVEGSVRTLICWCVVKRIRCGSAKVWAG